MSLDGDLESQLPDIRPVSDSTENNTEKKSDDGLTLVTGVQHGILLILTTWRHNKSWFLLSDSLKVPSSRFSSTTALYKESNAVEDPQQQLHDLIVDVGTAFISHGGPSHRVQPVIEALGQVFDVPTNVHTMNSQTVISFPPKNKRGPPAMYPIIKRGSMNFTKLPCVFDLVKRIVRDPTGLTMPNIYAELERIESLESAWNQYAIAASYVPAAATSAIMFFGGDWKDAAMSGVLALIPAALLLVANRWERLWVCIGSSHTALLLRVNGLGIVDIWMHCMLFGLSSGYYPFETFLLLDFDSLCSSHASSGIHGFYLCRWDND